MIGLAVAGAAVFVGAGALGAVRYVSGFALYRGEPPPSVPSSVAVKRHVHVRVVAPQSVQLSVKSAALGGRSVPVLVLLPPGYASQPKRHYPTIYLLEGYPAFGGPEQFVDIGDLAGLEAVLVAKHQMAPSILVMPAGSFGLFQDTEWANGVEPHSDWATFVSRDLVRAIDARFRAIDAGASRAIAGLSEGGYGALNIAIHHPGEFRVVESWSGYMLADRLPDVFGPHGALQASNSPADDLPPVAERLREDSTYIWFYTGNEDSLLAQNDAFDVELDRYRVAHQFAIFPGEHDWGLWRAHLGAALIAASNHLRDG